MEQLPWMKPDFDLRKVIAADASGAFRSSLERALDELAERLEMQRMACHRDVLLKQRIDGLLLACEMGRQVVAAAHCAAHGG